jgi:hypothetical protein
MFELETYILACYSSSPMRASTSFQPPSSCTRNLDFWHLAIGRVAHYLNIHTVCLSPLPPAAGTLSNPITANRHLRRSIISLGDEFEWLLLYASPSRCLRCRLCFHSLSPLSHAINHVFLPVATFYVHLSDFKARYLLPKARRYLFWYMRR